MLAHTRLTRILLLDGRLWADCAPRVVRHWLQRLHGLLTADDVGAANAHALVQAGLLDCLMALLSTGRLVASGTQLLATRLLLRVWHSVQFSLDVTKRLQDFLAATGAPGGEDVQLLCLRMLLKMVLHARATLEEYDSPAARAARAERQQRQRQAAAADAPTPTPAGGAAAAAAGGPGGAATAESASAAGAKAAASAAGGGVGGGVGGGGLFEVPHDGARSVLAALTPALLFSLLQHAASPRAVLLVVRLLVQLLLLASRFPDAAPFDRAFKELRGAERLAAVLPTYAPIPDICLLYTSPSPRDS